MGRHSAELEPVILPLPEQLAQADAMLANFGVTAEAQNGINEIDDEQAAAYTEVSDTIFDSLGILRDEAISSGENTSSDNFGVPEATIRLRRAADVASEALRLGYNRDAPDDELRATANLLIDDLDAFKRDGDSFAGGRNGGRFGRLRRAKELLIESAVSELGRRQGLDDDLSSSNLQAIQDETGVRIVTSEPWRAIFSSVIDTRKRANTSTGRHHRQAPPRQTVVARVSYSSRQEDDPLDGLYSGRPTYYPYRGSQYPVVAIDPHAGSRGGYVVQTPYGLQRIRR